jgi:hypothetical protein
MIVSQEYTKYKLKVKNEKKRVGSHKSRLLKNYFSIVILSEAKNLCVQFEKKNEILRRGGRPPLLRMTSLGDFSEVLSSSIEETFVGFGSSF